jgi:hypothetical protein
MPECGRGSEQTGQKPEGVVDHPQPFGDHTRRPGIDRVGLRPARPGKAELDFESGVETDPSLGHVSPLQGPDDGSDLPCGDDNPPVVPHVPALVIGQHHQIEVGGHLGSTAGPRPHDRDRAKIRFAVRPRLD